jgi:hypothetical protein
MSTAYRTVRADLEADRAAIAAVWARNRSHFTEDRYEWIYGAGASCPSAVWLLYAGESVVGAAALLTRRVRDGTVPRTFGQAIDLVVDPAHRTVGPGLALKNAVAGSCGALGLSAIYSFPNPRSESLMLRGGYRAIGPLERWTKPLRSVYKVERLLKAPALSLAVSRVVDGVLRLSPSEWAHGRANGAVGEEVAAFDASFDALWQSSRLVPEAFCGDRGTEYLTWRFVRCPRRTYRIFRVRDASGATSGYAVWYASKDMANVADLFARDEEALGVVAHLLVRHIRKTPAVAVSFAYLGPASIGRLLSRFGFFHRPEEAKVVVYSPAGGPKEGRGRPADWYLTEADRDV